MTREEAKEVFLNRGFIDGIYNGDKWREACIVISEWLEQEPKTGHWEEHNTGHSTYYDCSLCGCLAPCTETADSFIWKLSNFCPDCGAKMVEPQERKDKE